MNLKKRVSWKIQSFFSGAIMVMVCQEAKDGCTIQGLTYLSSSNFLINRRPAQLMPDLSAQLILGRRFFRLQEYRFLPTCRVFHFWGSRRDRRGILYSQPATGLMSRMI